MAFSSQRDVSTEMIGIKPVPPPHIGTGTTSVAASPAPKKTSIAGLRGVIKGTDIATSLPNGGFALTSMLGTKPIAKRPMCTDTASLAGTPCKMTASAAKGSVFNTPKDPTDLRIQRIRGNPGSVCISAQFASAPKSNTSEDTMSQMFGPLEPGSRQKMLDALKSTTREAACKLAVPTVQQIPAVACFPTTNITANSVLNSMFGSPVKVATHMRTQATKTAAVNTGEGNADAEYSSRRPDEVNPTDQPVKPRQQPKVSSIPSSATGRTNCSIAAPRIGSEGRPPNKLMATAAKQHLTLQKVEDLGLNATCKCKHGQKCLYRENLSGRMALSSKLHNLWDKFNSAKPKFHKGQALMNYMRENEKPSTGVFKAVSYKLSPADPEEICVDCWQAVTGFRAAGGGESRLFGETRHCFYMGMYNVVKDTDTKFLKNSGDLKQKLELSVATFLESWLEHNSDKIPEDIKAFNDLGVPRVHVDVPRKRDIWDACCEYLEKHYSGDPLGKGKRGATGKPISADYFFKILNKRVYVVMHKHKKFSQCVTCFLFKQLMAKCTNLEDRKEIRAHRKLHFDTVFAERVIYHLGRNYAKENPELAMSMILDGQTKWRTQSPTLTRQLGSGFSPDFEAFGQQLYGCLVHALPGDTANKGGFFGYMVDDSVKGGGNVTCEIIYETLKKMQEHREVWPPLLDIRLDNTTKDNKNKCVFGFCAWLILTGAFKTVRIRYLSVGHTHEDIDALFGVLMQHLYRGRAFPTVEILMDEIYKSFFTTDSKHASGNRPSSPVQHMRATHDWTSFLTMACEQAAQLGEEGCVPGAKNKPACRKIEKYARRVPDAFRPHEFVFTKKLVKGEMRVVLDYKHFSKDEAYWNKEPILVFNHEPDLKDLKPAKLNPAVLKPLEKCVGYPAFGDHSLICNRAKGPEDENGERSPSKCGKCPRCKVQVAFSEEYGSSLLFNEENKDAWAKRWAQMTQESANSSLTDVTELRKYTVHEPRAPYVLPTRLQGPSDAYLSVEPVTYEGYTEARYQKMLRQVGVGVVNESVSSFAVKVVCGVKRDSSNKVQVAVVWEEEDTTEGGTWIELDDLNVLFTEEIQDSEPDEAYVPTPAELEESNANDVRRHNWELYFGRDVDEDLNVLVGFKSGRNTTVYQGVVLMPDYNDSTGIQHVHFPIIAADTQLGTAAQEAAKDKIEIRLDTLECTPPTEDCVVAFWVMKEYATLPFIKKGLPALKISVPRVTKSKRREKIYSNSDSDANDRRKQKKAKPILAEAARKTRQKKKTNKETTAEMMSQMRNTPVV